MRGTDRGSVVHSFEEHGVVADAYMHRASGRPRRRRPIGWIPVLVALAFVSALVIQAIAERPHEGDTAMQEVATRETDETHELVVYTLDHTTRYTSWRGTLFTFDSGNLPFDFRDLLFGVLHRDANISSRCYAGMSMLASAYGQSANITFSEPGGKVIEKIVYEGQALIVLNGWESISRDSEGGIIHHVWGSMQIAAYDWRDGLWQPERGVFIEHPRNVTVSSAALCLMVYEPDEGREIPEFGHATALMLLATVLVLAWRRRYPHLRPRRGKARR